MKGKITSGRSARLPPTPTSNDRNVQKIMNVQTNNPYDENKINALGPDLAVATSHVLDSLSDQERQIILNVLNRDEGIRQRDATRIMILKSELHSIRRRGALKTCGSLDRPNIESNKSCSRCRVELGKVINRGAPCRSCRQNVCKACREFTVCSTDWVCIVCHKYMEIQAASGEWLNEYSTAPPRRDSLTQEYLPASDIIKTSIKRSWTISSPPQNYQGSSEYQQDPDEYNSGRQPPQFINRQMDCQNNEYNEPQRYPPRRVLRQSTLPSNLPNPNQTFTNTVNLAPAPPANQQLSPQYNSYNTENDDVLNCSNSDLRQSRYPMRRQSTLPCRPNDQNYLSTSPNRCYSRSPEKYDTDHRYPPFVRQSTFPSNATEQFVNRPKILLPPSPNRINYNKSPESINNTEKEFPTRHGIMRQSTLPNPEHHVKLLPTSPSKRQTSPQYIKRSPEMTRQNTLPNPDGMSSLGIPQHSSKFLPISPRQKQNFLFPQADRNPRQFLSQQNVPTIADDPYSSTGSVSGVHREHPSKMIKVRSHSNEEYGANRPPLEGRRLLPEIPRNRSPSKLVRQGHVLEDASRANQYNTEQKKTFAEAKQHLVEYEETNTSYEPVYNFLEVDEDESYEVPQYKNVYSASDSKVRYDNDDNQKPKVGHTVRSAESFLNDCLPEYCHPEEGARVKREKSKRRKSRDIFDGNFQASSNEDEPRRKPETMRSISEDTPSRPVMKPVTRRSLSHPEKEIQNSKRNEHIKIPSPKPLADILEKSKREKSSKIPSPRRNPIKFFEKTESLPNTTTIRDKQETQISKSPIFSTVAILHKEPKNEIDSDNNEDSENTETKKDVVADENETIIEAEKEHKSTLGEAEIQSAVEAAAVIFKKVVLQRRQAANKKLVADEGEYIGYRNNMCVLDDTNNVSDYEQHSTMKIVSPESDDYKLVYLSSDSSSKEDEYEDSSSTTSSITTVQSIPLDDCDWDYFELGATAINIKPIYKDIYSMPQFNLSNPNKLNLSQLESIDPSLLFIQKINETDTGTDEESETIQQKDFINTFKVTKDEQHIVGGLSKEKIEYYDSLNREKPCQCGGSKPQYVPIPVPIPVSITDFKNWKSSTDIVNRENLNLRDIQRKQAANIFQLWNTAAPHVLLQPKENNVMQNKESKTPLTTSTQRNFTGILCKSTHEILDEENHQLSSIDQTVDRAPPPSSTTTSSKCKTHLSAVNINEKQNCTQLSDVDKNEENTIFISNTLPKNTLTADHENVVSRFFDDDNNIIKGDCFATTNDTILTQLNNKKVDTDCYNEVIQRQYKHVNNNITRDIDTSNSSSGSNISNIVSDPNVINFNLIVDSVKKSVCISSQSPSLPSMQCERINDDNYLSKINYVADMNSTKSNILVNSVEPSGYLESENVFHSSESADSNDDNDDSDSINIKRSYDIVNETYDDDDILKSGSSDVCNSDCEDRLSLSSSAREDPSSNCSDSSDDSNEKNIGTIANRKPKSKNVYKVFIVNKNNSSSDSSAQSSNANSTDDSSDDDTDTDQVCDIVLNYVKPITEGDEIEINSAEASKSDDTVLCSIKYLPKNDDSLKQNFDLTRLNFNKHIAPKGNNENADILNNEHVSKSNSLLQCETNILSDLNTSINKLTKLSLDTKYNELNEITDLHEHSCNVKKEEEIITNYADEQRIQKHSINKINNDQTNSIIIPDNNFINIQRDNFVENVIKHDEYLKNTNTLSDDNNTILNECHMVINSSNTNINSKKTILTTIENIDNDIICNSGYKNEIENNIELISKNKDKSTIIDIDHQVENNTPNSYLNPNEFISINERNNLLLDNAKATLLIYGEKDKNKINDQSKVVAANIDYDRKTSFLSDDEGGTAQEMQSITKSALSFLEKSDPTTTIKTTTTSSSTIIEDNSCDDHNNIVKHQQQNFTSDCTTPALQTLTTIQSNDHHTICCTGNNNIIMNPTSSGVKHAKYSGSTYESSCLKKQNTNENSSADITVHLVEKERSNIVDENAVAAAAKSTSLIMITQDKKLPGQVSVVTSDTTRIVSANNEDSDIIVQHTNWQTERNKYERNSFSTAFTKSFENDHFEIAGPSNLKKLPIKHITTNVSGENLQITNENVFLNSAKNVQINNNKGESVLVSNDDVTVVTGADTLSAVVCLEDGLADDDSWVEEISHDEEEFATTTATDSEIESSEELTLCTVVDREEELRGFNRSAIDFTLHTIVEESCEDSEVEVNNKNKNRISASELEKYYFYGLGDGKLSTAALSDYHDGSLSESDSIYSDGVDSIGGSAEGTTTGQDTNDAIDLASSRLEKYFLSTFMGFTAEQQCNSDGSGSVGSDSEGRPSPEQRRKRLVRARGTPRSHNSSLDNLLASNSDNHESSILVENPNDSIIDSSESDICDETVIHISDSQTDTLKRKKMNRKRNDSMEADNKKQFDLSSSTTTSIVETNDSENDKCKTPTLLDSMLPPSNLVQSRKQCSRDSGFIGSNDDLLKTEDTLKSPELILELEEIEEDVGEAIKDDLSSKDNKNLLAVAKSIASGSTLSRKDSFNNWSSDEETNVMMSKMRQFFKTLVAASANAQNIKIASKPSTPVVSESNTPKSGTPLPRLQNKNKPPQLLYFESELTRLMKTVPGINDDQVREIVEYLSSEDTWSDSYDSSDYTSSDLEGAANASRKSELQEQISASCQEIIEKFDTSIGDEEGDRGDGGLFEDSQGLHKETALVYQKLVASFSKMATTEEQPPETTANTSPPIFAKVMGHIGTRLVALMHEVSSGESHEGTSPKAAVRFNRKIQQQKISATTTEDDDSTSDSYLEKNEGLGYLNLPRSKSHDLLLSSNRSSYHQSSAGVLDINAEEKEASDYERFSWRGSFESALLANGDSRTKLSLLEKENSSSAASLAAKRRSAGDLLFNQKSLSREQLDRVRSCGSIGGDHNIESSKLWSLSPTQRTDKRRSSVPDASCDSENNTSEDEHNFATRSTLPRSLQNTSSASTNSLPRLSTSNIQTTIQKSQSVYQFLPNSVKSARYRPPGFNRLSAIPKKAVSSPGLQQSLYTKRDTRRRAHSYYNEDTNTPEVGNSPVIGSRHDSGESSSPVRSIHATAAASSDPWPAPCDEDIDRLVALHQNRSSLSSLGIRSDSMASVYSGAGEGRYGTVAVKGQVEFGMQYNYKQGALEIHILQCKDLAAVDTKRNRSDPYVKLYLLPDKSKSGKRKTRVKKHTLNPIFDETVKFYMSLSSLESRSLWLTVWHSDMFGRNDFLGEVTINLQGKVFDNPQPKSYTLQERSEPFDDVTTYRGDIIVGLKFIPPDSATTSAHHSTDKNGGNISLRKFGSIKSTTRNTSSKGALHVLVKEGKNLTAVKANGSCDAFCKSYLLPDKNRSSKQKTPVVKRTTNPAWNYTFIYDDVTLSELSERALELTIWDHDRLSSNEFLGGVRFSLGSGKYYGKTVDWMDSTGKELSLWQSMLNRPNFWVEGCVILRSSLDGGRFNG